MLQVFSSPIALDAIRVCIDLAPDQREHWSAMTGQSYDIDAAALGAYMQAGPKWVIHANSRPIVFGGFVPKRPGVYQDFLLSTPEAFLPECYFGVTRICRRLMDGMLKGGVHRLECYVPVPRVTPKLHKWYATLGYNKEALLHGYCASGADAFCYSRVRH
jgi:hypothetical protein